MSDNSFCSLFIFKVRFLSQTQFQSTIFYQDYRNDAKSNGKSVAFFGDKRLLSQTLFSYCSTSVKVAAFSR